MGQRPFLLVPLLAVAASSSLLLTEAARPYPAATAARQNQRLPIRRRRSLLSPEGSVFLPHPTPIFENYLENPVENLIGRMTPTEEMFGVVAQNLNVLNQAFQETPFRFTLVGRNILEQEGAVSTVAPWTDDMLSFRKEMAFELRKGGLESLNIYLSYRLTADANETASGFATFPSYQATTTDGIWTTYDRLSGGGDATNDLGFNLVQLVGRWMGLYSTFATNALGNWPVSSTDLCDVSINENDYVEDTPVHLAPNGTCLDFLGLSDEELPVTCPNATGPDPIFNFMSLVDDEVCWLEKGSFTCGQIQRMRSQWDLYRKRKDEDACEEDNQSFWTRFTMRLGESSSSRTTKVTLTQVSNVFQTSRANLEQKVFFDSQKDHDDWYAQDGFQDFLSVTLCLSKDANYTLQAWTYTLGESGSKIAIETFPSDGDVTLFIGDKLKCDLEPQETAAFTSNTMECNGVFSTDSTDTTLGMGEGESGGPSLVVGWASTWATGILLVSWFGFDLGY